MKQSQAEIKAIEAELKSIRAEKSPSRPPSPTLFGESSVAKPKGIKTPITMVDSSQTQGRTARQVDFNSSSLQGFPVQSNLAQTNYPQDNLADTVEMLQRRSASYLKQLSQPPMPERLSGSLQSLEAQAQHINQLSAMQEAAILELKSIARKVESDRKAAELASLEPKARDGLNSPPLCEYLTATVPHIEKTRSGGLVLTTRSVDLFKAEREAALTAQALRHLSARQPQQPSRSLAQQIWRWLSGSATPTRRLNQLQPQVAQGTDQTPVIRSKPRPQLRKRPHRALRTRRPSSADSVFTLRQGLTLMLGAVAVRVGVNLAVQAFPMLLVPGIVVLVMPAAIAVYRTSTSPQTGFAWAYRLFSIMIGLLLGGRL